MNKAISPKSPEQKTLYSINEIELRASKQIEKCKRDRKMWKKVFGTNETAMDFCDQARKLKNDLTNFKKDKVEILRIYQDIIRYYFIGLGVAYFKEKNLNRESQSCQQNYLTQVLQCHFLSY